MKGKRIWWLIIFLLLVLLVLFVWSLVGNKGGAQELPKTKTELTTFNGQSKTLYCDDQELSVVFSDELIPSTAKVTYQNEESVLERREDGEGTFYTNSEDVIYRERFGKIILSNKSGAHICTSDTYNDDSILTQNAWQWSDITTPEEVIKPDALEDYVLVFSRNGQLRLEGNCGLYVFDYKTSDKLVSIDAPDKLESWCDSAETDILVQALGNTEFRFLVELDQFLHLTATDYELNLIPAVLP